MKNQNGITLIALVITILVLMILAGVAINLTLGDNGILRKAETAKENYNLAREKEALEIEIMEVQVEILETEGRNATLNDLQNKIDTSKYTIELHFESIATTQNVNTVPTYAIVNRINTMYYFTVDAKLVITDVELAEPARKYINFSEVTWENGKASITLSTTETGTIEYKIGEDGTYQEGTTIGNLNHADVVYARINNNGEYTEEETKIIYDGIEPEEFEITVPEDSITYEAIKLSTTGTIDNQTGLATYSYVAATSSSEIVQRIENPTVTEYTITGLSPETEYVVYVLAYDNAGNVRKSNEVTITTPAIPAAKTFGQYVNYGIDLDDDGNTTNDWQIFYKEDDPTSPNYGATYIIADYYVPYTKIETSLANAGMSIYQEKYMYSLRWNSVPTYRTITDGTDNTINVKSIFMYDFSGGTGNSNVKCVSTLLDVTAWKDDFVTTQLQAKGGMAIGAPTINMWIASWNKAYPTETLTPTINGAGYEGIDLRQFTGYKTDAPNVYFPTMSADNNITSRYWIASPGETGTNGLMSVEYTGLMKSTSRYISDKGYVYSDVGLRPVVYLPKEVTLEPSATPDVWNINYGN